jgi:hypothetical protein
MSLGSVEAEGSVGVLRGGGGGQANRTPYHLPTDGLPAPVGPRARTDRWMGLGGRCPSAFGEKESLTYYVFGFIRMRDFFVLI